MKIHTSPPSCTEEFNGTLDGGKGAWEVTDTCDDPTCASSLQHSAAQDKPRQP